MIRLIFLVLALLSAGCAPLGYPGGALRYVQQERADHGLPPLAWDGSLLPAVSERAATRATALCFDHDGIDGVLASSPAADRYVCELVGRQPAGEVSYAVGWGWVESPPHRACIDDHLYTRFAIAAVVGADGWIYEVLWLTD